MNCVELIRLWNNIIKRSFDERKCYIINIVLIVNYIFFIIDNVGKEKEFVVFE